MLSTLEQIAARSIHISTKPPPRSLAETKLILAALQKFGEVVTFRNLRYDTTNTSASKNSTTVVIFDSAASATQATESSPLLVALPPQTQTQIQNLNLNLNSSPTHLTCYIAPSHHNHESALKRNPFYTRFELDQSSAIYRDLVENTGIPRPELADVPTARKEFLPMNDRKRAHYSTVRMGGGSLMGLYRDGAARAERRKGGLHGREGEGEEVFEGGNGNEKGKAKKVG
ncbi:hypothetical protein ARAM_005542 [Aspergillus rambellii]|uniref:Uncharacterized protein n=1 Tax=Aspergillus rambellii TaxID=308745 RepID=A0A0F8XIG9_9EURO|nr:hypothetical protein ARAM_005542 [Aspergillus rambellii]